METRMRIGKWDHDAFVAVVKDFHGHVAPGVIIGGYMVEMARRTLPEGILYDAVSETVQCLPDAIQLLTPCTVGNGWLKVYHFGIYALSLYDKYTGDARPSQRGGPGCLSACAGLVPQGKAQA